jgi:SAM-dependent methyltransferase
MTSAPPHTRTTPQVAPFEAHHERYEAWFVRHQPAYVSELLAVRTLLPWRGRGLEIGVGSGRFASPLGVGVGLDPSPAMLTRARRRGVAVCQGLAEALPFAAASLDYALVVTAICFVRDAAAMLSEARRVLRPGGPLVIGFIDRETPLGQEYLAHQAQNVFYRPATFYSAHEVEDLLLSAGFHAPEWLQTLTGPLSDLREPEPARPGHGRGAFVAVRAARD